MARTPWRRRSDGSCVRVIHSIRAGLKAAALALLTFATCAAAIEPSVVSDLAGDDSDARDKAITSLVSSGAHRALPLLEGWRKGNARHDANGRMFLVDGD